MAGPYLSWSCSTADCQLRLSVLYGTMQVHYVESSGGRDPLHRETRPLSPGTEATPNAQPSGGTHHLDGIAKAPDQAVPK